MLRESGGTYIVFSVSSSVTRQVSLLLSPAVAFSCSTGCGANFGRASAGLAHAASSSVIERDSGCRDTLCIAGEQVLSRGSGQDWPLAAIMELVDISQLESLKH